MHIILLSTPPSLALYSNLGFTLLGRSTERALGEKYEDAVVSEILTPLNMTSRSLFFSFSLSFSPPLITEFISSGFEFTEKVQQRMATGYTTTSTGPLYTQEVSAYNTQQLYFSAPAGGMFGFFMLSLVFVFVFE